MRNSCCKDDELKNLLPNLSDRELELMVLFAFGVRRQEAAKKLGVSPRTIDTYVDRIKHKFGLSGSRDLARQAILLKDCLTDLYKSSR